MSSKKYQQQGKHNSAHVWMVSIHMLFKRFSAKCFMTILMKVINQITDLASTFIHFKIIEVFAISLFILVCGPLW